MKKLFLSVFIIVLTFLISAGSIGAQGAVSPTVAPTASRVANSSLIQEASTNIMNYSRSIQTASRNASILNYSKQIQDAVTNIMNYSKNLKDLNVSDTNIMNYSRQIQEATTNIMNYSRSIQTAAPSDTNIMNYSRQIQEATTNIMNYSGTIAIQNSSTNIMNYSRSLTLPTSGSFMRGGTGDANPVFNVFYRLGFLPTLPTATDRSFGPTAEIATQNFQKLFGINPTGKFGSQELNALKQFATTFANATLAPSFPKDAKKLFFVSFSSKTESVFNPGTGVFMPPEGCTESSSGPIGTINCPDGPIASPN